MIRVCHLTSVHPRYDVRIFYKECVSLAFAGYEVYLIVADGMGDEVKEGVHIVDVGKRETSRISRFIKTANIVFKKAIDLKAALYHIHDPELLRIAFKLNNKQTKVLYDAHEDLPRQILSKQYINQYTRKAVSVLTENLEVKIVRKLNGVIAASPAIRNRFLRVNKNTIDINNYPIIDKALLKVGWKDRE
ncbi:MAG: glycosyltransferase, partial [Chitinophagaceae bacterium]